MIYKKFSGDSSGWEGEEEYDTVPPKEDNEDLILNLLGLETDV